MVTSSNKVGDPRPYTFDDTYTITHMHEHECLTRPSDLSRSCYLPPPPPPPPPPSSQPSYVQGQPGGNLPSGNQSKDALDYLVNWLHATTTGNADNPIEEEDFDDDADNDADGSGGAGKKMTLGHLHRSRSSTARVRSSKARRRQ